MISPRMLPLYTLIVDDDIIVCQHTKMILDQAGLNTEWIDSGPGAIKKVTDQHNRKKDYDLILLDWKMPDMDGIETAREIRKIVGPEVTIIIMTAYDWADIEKKAMAAGVDMFMKKPIFASSVTKAFENVFMRKNNISQEETNKKEYDFAGKRILLAEDNEINAEISKSLIESKHCQVELAVNGAEAVESFASAPVNYYDAILMDVRMPVMDGLEASKTIRAMRKEGSKTIPIIAMTANAFDEDVQDSLKSGMNAHLAKPIEPEKLFDTLQKFFSHKE
jgi:two-component system sensor histidine kinase/response regulator